MRVQTPVPPTAGRKEGKEKGHTERKGMNKRRPRLDNRRENKQSQLISIKLRQKMTTLLSIFVIVSFLFSLVVVCLLVCVVHHSCISNAIVAFISPTLHFLLILERMVDRLCHCIFQPCLLDPCQGTIFIFVSTRPTHSHPA